MGQVNVNVSISEKLAGVWLSDKSDSDVHVYAGKPDGVTSTVVIGQNKDYNDKVEFSDLAVSFTQGEVTLQYADEKGQPKFVVVNPKVARSLLLAFLQSVKAVSAND